MSTDSAVDLYPPTEAISKDCHHATIGEEDIILVEMHSDKRETIAAWLDFSERIRATWNTAEPMLILVDLSFTDFYLSPYALSRSQSMLQINQHISSYIAFVIRPTFVTNILRVTIDAASRAARTTQFKIANTREEAYEWLHTAWKTQG